MVSIISTIHVIDFFRLSNPNWLAITLAIAFEVGAAASLAAIIILDKTSRWLVWMLFVIITLMQMMGNMYYAYTHLTDFQSWSELFSINEEEPIFQKRILSLVSGAILPIVALGFIKSLVDYIRPSSDETSITSNDIPIEYKEEDSLIEIEEETLDIEEEPLDIEEKVTEVNNDQPYSGRRIIGGVSSINGIRQNPSVKVENKMANEDKYPKENLRGSTDYRHPSQDA
jgi:hypothetical protein